MLDIGCGQVSADYAFASYADTVVAVDWRLEVKSALTDKVGLPFGRNALKHRVSAEFEKDCGSASFNMTVQFCKAHA